jgi:chromosome partitioning protein
MAAKIISIINLKGGVGKSTLAMVLGEFLVFRYGKKILLIDMDAQGNLSYCMVPANQIETQERNGRTVYHLTRAHMEGNSVDVEQFITHPPLVVSNIARSAAMNYPGVIDMIVSVPAVAELDEDLLRLWETGRPMPSRLRVSLAEALEPARDKYDYVLIDCPPGLSLFSSAALMASDYYISPIIPEPLSLQGVNLVQRRARELSERYAHRLQFKGVVLNIVKHYRNTHQRIADEIYSTQQSRYEPFQFWLPDNERLRKVGEFDPDLPGTWAGGMGAKFATLNEKYSLSYRLTNPAAGLLNRSNIEGSNYRLEDRIYNLVEEFQERCR